MNHLIANELDIEIPPITNFDIEQFIEDTAKDYYEKYAIEEINWLKNRQIKFPWFKRATIIENIYTFNTVKYDSLIPIHNLAKELLNNVTGVMIYQKEQPNYEVSWHFDSLDFSYRIIYHLNNRQSCLLEFAELKQEYYELRSALTDINVKLDKTLFFTPIKNNTVIGATGIGFPHRPALINATERLIFVFKGTPRDHSYNTLQELYWNDQTNSSSTVTYFNNNHE